MCDRHGAGRALGLSIDVTRRESIAACFRQIVRRFGGFDLLLSNAGVLKAGPIEEMDEQSFDLVTNINYKAYWLCVKASTPVMKTGARNNATSSQAVLTFREALFPMV